MLSQVRAVKTRYGRQADKQPSSLILLSFHVFSNDQGSECFLPANDESHGSSFRCAEAFSCPCEGCMTIWSVTPPATTINIQFHLAQIGVRACACKRKIYLAAWLYSPAGMVKLLRLSRVTRPAKDHQKAASGSPGHICPHWLRLLLILWPFPSHRLRGLVRT